MVLQALPAPKDHRVLPVQTEMTVPPVLKDPLVLLVRKVPPVLTAPLVLPAHKDPQVQQVVLELLVRV
jgi:hypothetical protein